ncbi:MAG: hypothetical protein IPK85_04500 [Gemmatimonadetes bacterium]|nr:hypothetical protein [Gemmatimonadota bacterium]
MSRDLSDFMFRGLITSHAVRDMEATGRLRPKRADPTQRDDAELFSSVSEAIRSGSVYMQRCYRLLFVLENLVREFVQDVLQEKDGPEWFERRASQPMMKKVDDRRETETRNQWHAGRNTHPVNYVDFGDLGLLIQNHWAEFRDLLPTQAWAVSRLSDAERTRNVIAHTNRLSSEELARLELIVSDWIKQVG